MGQTPFVQSPLPQPPYMYYPPVNPIAVPVKVIGIVYAVFAALSLISFLLMAAMSTAGFLMQVTARSMEGPVFLVIAGIVLFAAFLNGATAYGLLTRKSWGRIFAIVVSILSLLSIPFGTVLGEFALYFLMRQGAEQDYILLTLSQS